MTLTTSKPTLMTVRAGVYRLFAVPILMVAALAVDGFATPVSVSSPLSTVEFENSLPSGNSFAEIADLQPQGLTSGATQPQTGPRVVRPAGQSPNRTNKPGSKPGGRSRNGHGGGGYQGPGGVGKPGDYKPGGIGAPKAPDGGGPGGIGQPGGQPGDGPGGIGQPGGPGQGGGNTGSPGGSPPAFPGAGAGGGVPIPGEPGRRTKKRQSVLADDSWLNWWQLNELHELDLERRYRERIQQHEVDEDLFLGEPMVGPARPIDGGSERIRKKIMPTLEELARDKDARVRAEVALAIGRAGRSDAVTRLVPMTKDKHLQVRKSALFGLGLTGEKRAYPYLARALKDPTAKDVEKAFAALALGVLGDVRAVGPLIDAIERRNQNLEIKAAALFALGRTPSSRARVFLEYFVLRPLNDDRLRATAIHGLAGQGGAKHTNVFLDALEDANVHVRRSAAIASGLVSFTSADRADLDAVERDFARGFDSGGLTLPRAREEIENYIGRLRVKVEEDERKLGMLKSSAVRRLEKAALGDADLLVRYFAMISLGRIGGDEAVTALSEIVMRGKANSARSFAALGLALSKHSDASAPLRRVLTREKVDERTRAAIILALGLLEERKSEPAVLKQFRTRQGQDVQSFSALALGLFESTNAKRRIRDTLTSRSRPELKRRFGASAGLLGDEKTIEELQKRLARRAPAATSVAFADALALIPDERSLDAVLGAINKGRMKDSVKVASVRALGALAEKGTRPITSDMFRGLNYLLRFQSMNEAALL